MPTYGLAGVIVESQLRLPLLEERAALTPSDVLLELASPLAPEDAPSKAEWNWKSHGEAELSYPGLGRAWITGGEKIILRPCAQTGEGATEWRGLIIPCFAALFHQRGSHSLHASAVCIDGKAVGFMGFCGDGKSTTVAQLIGGNIRFLCDDLLLLGPGDAGNGVLAYPGFSIIKLWDDAVRGVGGRLSRLGRLYPDAAKDGFAPSGEESESAPAPLQCLFVLEEGREVEIRPLSKCEALGVLLGHTYGAQTFDAKPLPVHFQQCSELAAKVPVKLLIRPKNFSSTEDVKRAVLEALEKG